MKLKGNDDIYLSSWVALYGLYAQVVKAGLYCLSVSAGRGELSLRYWMEDRLRGELSQPSL